MILPHVINVVRMIVKETVRKIQSVFFAKGIMQHGRIREAEIISVRSKRLKQSYNVRRC